VWCSVSAYGHAGAYADAPGFDPVFQALSGLADAQGGDGEPVLAPVPLNDIGTGALGALGALAAMYARDRAPGTGQRLRLSLANTATFLQAPEFTAYAGRPEPACGGPDYPGPASGHRFFACADGWVAVAAGSAALVEGLRAALGVPAAGDDQEAAGLAEALGALPAADAVALLRGRGIPAARVVTGEGHATDPHLLGNAFQHMVEDPRFGRISIVQGYGDWRDGDPGGRVPRAVLVGHDTRPVLADAGYTPAEIDALLAGGVVADIDLSDVEEGARVAPARHAPGAPPAA
jgi:crotonobetainyl-CoA:carnitine CoA-transferase CaiB-like acyl-CoA transferase